jgi:hypothetical protein
LPSVGCPLLAASLGCHLIFVARADRLRLPHSLHEIKSKSSGEAARSMENRFAIALTFQHIPFESAAQTKHYRLAIASPSQRNCWAKRSAGAARSPSQRKLLGKRSAGAAQSAAKSLRNCWAMASIDSPLHHNAQKLSIRFATAFVSLRSAPSNNHRNATCNTKRSKRVKYLPTVELVLV